MKKLIKTVVRGIAHIAVRLGHIFRKDGGVRNPAGQGTGNQARPRKRLVDGVDADRFTQLCVVLVVGFVTIIGAILISAAVNSGSREIPVDSQNIENRPDGLTLAIGGDIMPSQDMLDCALGSGGYNFNNDLSELAGPLSGDLTIAGLCGQIDVNSHNQGVGGFDNGMNYPDELAAALSQTGINYVMGANRWAFANGYDGMCASITHLHTNSVGVIGLTNTDARKINTGVIRRGGIGIGLACYNCVSSEAYESLTDEQKTYIAQAEKDPDALAERAAADMTKMRSGGAEFIVVCVNWGGASTTEPSEFIKQAAKKIAEAGADVIVGYGPYVTLAPEIISYQFGSVEKECYVFYSLGVMCGDNHYSSKTLDKLTGLKKLSDAQQKQLKAEKQKAAAANKAMTRSMTVSLKVTRARNGSVNVESATYSPIYLVKNTAQSEENAHLSYIAVEAAKYIAAEERPPIFADDKQWQLCREAYTAICALADQAEGKLIPAGAAETDSQTDTRI